MPRAKRSINTKLPSKEETGKSKRREKNDIRDDDKGVSKNEVPTNKSEKQAGKKRKTAAGNNHNVVNDGNDEITGSTKKRKVTKKGETSDDENPNVTESTDDLATKAVPKTGTPVFHPSNKYVGAHVSVAGSLENAVLNAVEIGAKAFALYVRSPRTWKCKPLTEEIAQKFRDAMEEHGFPPHLVLPHGMYLLNCGSPKEEGLEKSREAIIDELKRCEMLGLTLYNFHPGSTCGEISVDECVSRIAESINLAHKETKYVTTVLENMSCQGNTIGGRFEELRAIIDQVDDKSRVGVCLDTCHAFAAGYDLSQESGFNQMMKDFELKIGLKYLRALHLNDSKGKVGCHLDRHENIGKGHIGLVGFQRIMNDSRFNNIPLILETPMQLDDDEEIKILYKMCRK